MVESQSNKVLYSLQDVSLKRDGSIILSDINQTIDRDRVYLIAGPSGSGKTSILKLLNGLVFPTAGTLLFDGRRIQDYDLPKLRSRAVLLTQQPILVDGTVMDNLRLPFEFSANIIQGFNHDSAIEALKRVGLSEAIAERETEKLSGGEKQRVALARALLLKPDVLIADEPTSSLDITSEERIVRLFEELKGKMTIVTVSHSTRFLEFADKVILLSEGRIDSTRDSIDAAEFREFLDIEENTRNG